MVGMRSPLSFSYCREIIAGRSRRAAAGAGRPGIGAPLVGHCLQQRRFAGIALVVDDAVDHAFVEQGPNQDAGEARNARIPGQGEGDVAFAGTRLEQANGTMTSPGDGSLPEANRVDIIYSAYKEFAGNIPMYLLLNKNYFLA
jgi:hypothetical protein